MVRDPGRPARRAQAALVGLAALALSACAGGEGPPAPGPAAAGGERAAAASPGAGVASTEEGVRLVRAGDLAGAEPILLRALERDPRDTRALDALGWVYGHTDRWQKAEQTYRSILAFDPEAPGALFGLATTLTDLGRYPEALEAIGRFRQRLPDDPRGRIKEAVLLERLGRPEEAEKRAREAIARDPKDPEAHYILGLCLEDRGDLAGAVEALERTVAIDPYHLGALGRLPGLDLRLGRKEAAARARAAHRAALERRNVQERVRGHRNRGVDAFNRQDYETALTEFQAVAREDPKDPQAPLYAGSSLIALGRYQEARASLERSLEIEPRNERALMELGRLEALQEHLDAAVDDLRKAIAVNPDFPEPHYFLAGIHMARGETDAAKREMQRFQELKARSPGRSMELAAPTPMAPR